MATLAIGAAGAAAGALIAPALGGTALLGAQLGFTAGTILGTFLFPPDPIKGPRLSDLKITASTYGRPKPIGYGTQRVGGNTIWGQRIKEVKRTESGKGGPSVVSYRYFGNFAVGFAEGPAQYITKMWADGKLILDLTGTNPVVSDVLLAGKNKDLQNIVISEIEEGVLDEAQFSGISIGRLRIYLGTETQLPDPWIQADVGVSDTPAYRGLVYAVFQDIPLEDFGNRLPQITAEVAFSASDAFPFEKVTNLGQPTSTARWDTSFQHFYIRNALNTIHYRYDAINKVLISQARVEDTERGGSNDVGALFTFNALGQYYGHLSVGGSSRYYKIDGDTHAILSQTGHDASGEFPGTIGAAVTSDGHLVVISSTSWIGSWDGVDSSTVNQSQHTDLDFQAVTVGDDDRAWVSARLSGSPTSCVIAEVDPYSGSLKNQYTIEGFVPEGKIFYDLITDSVYFIDNQKPALVRFRLDTFTADAFINLSAAIVTADNAATLESGAFGGRIWLQNGGSQTFIEIDLLSMSIVRTIDTADWVSAVALYRPIYSPRENALITQQLGGTDLYWIYLDRKSTTAVTLSSIVDDISDRVNISSSERDTSELTDLVHGYVLGNRMSGRQALEPLQVAYFFDVRESDWLVDFVKRGGSSVASIPEDDLGAVASLDGSGQAFDIEEIRLQELELPERVDITYPDVDIDYETMTQHAKRAREAINTRDLVEIGLPIAFDGGDEPAQIADKILYSAYAERTRYRTTLSWEHVRLDAADPIEITRGDTTFRLRLTQVEYDADGIIHLRGVSEDVATYISTLTGATADGNPDQVIEQTGPSALYMMDQPLFRDIDEDTSGLIIYSGIGSYGQNSWPGAQVFESPDNADFTESFAFANSSNNITHGTTTTALASGTTTIFDTDNTITIRLFRGSLESSTRLGVLNGANAILIGEEIVQFVTAVDNGDGTWTLSTLLRGRRGTEWAVDSHIANERAVLLTSDTILRTVIGSDELAKTRYYKAVTIGGELSSASSRSLTHAGRSKKPLSPVHIQATVSLGTWTITWFRRTRLGGQWRDGVDVPLAEATEDYEVDILDGSGNVLRTITTTASANGSVVTPGSQQATYDNDDVIEDFGSPGTSSLDVKVYQLSDIVGRGFSGDATLQAA